MDKYTYANIIIDPYKEDIESLIGKEVYFETNPFLCLKAANEKLSLNSGILVEVYKDSINPFCVKGKSGSYKYPCIIEKKEKPKPKPKYIPFENVTEFIDAYRSVARRLGDQDLYLSNHGIWLKAKDAGDVLFMVTEIWSYGVVFSGDMKTTEELDDEYLTITEATTWEELLVRYTFIDGSPCGKLAEEDND